MLLTPLVEMARAPSDQAIEKQRPSREEGPPEDETR
jgi:hypothetical protein